jgi:hypothetical protein
VFALIAQGLPGETGTALAHFSSERVITLKFPNRSLELAKGSTDKSTLTVGHEVMKLVPCRDNRDAPGQHCFHHRSSPRFFDPMPKRIDKKIEAIKKFQG